MPCSPMRPAGRTRSSASATWWATGPTGRVHRAVGRARASDHGGQPRARRRRPPRPRLVQPLRACGGGMDARASRRRSSELPLGAATGRARGRRDARPRLARPPRGVGVPHVGRGRLQGVRGVHDAPLLRGALPPAGRVVARLDGPRVDARYGGGRPRARPPLPRERGERRPAPRPRPTRGVRALGRRAWSDRHQTGAVRRRCRPAQDHRWRPAPVPRRSPRVGRLIGASALREDLALAALLSGSAIGLALAFPRTDWDGVAWLLVVPVIVTALGAAPRAALGWGWLFGTVFFLVLLRWLGYTFGVYSAIPWPLTWVPIVALAAYCGLYVGAFTWAVSWIGRRRAPALALAAAPFLWVTGEWVRARLLGGFPWGTLGYSQYLGFPVIPIAALGGVHAVSFVLVAVNTAVAGCLVLPWRGALAGAALAGTLLAATLAFGSARLAAPARPGEVTGAIVQPSIEQPLKVG